MSRAAAPPAPLWRDQGFRTFWGAQSVSQLGDRVSELALPLIAVLALDASAGQVGLLTAAVWAPNLLSLFVGAWIDNRTHKRRLLVLADLARATILLSLPVAYLLGAVTLGQLYVVALLTGAAGVVFNMTYPAFFVTLVPRAGYVDANSKLSATRAGSFVAGPPLGGALVQALSAPVAVVVDAASFLVSALLLWRIPLATAPAVPTKAPLIAGAREGLRFVVHHPVLRASLGCAATVNFFTFMANALLVLFASRTLGLTAGLIGVALGVGAAGGLAGALLAPALARVIGIGRSIVVGAVVFPAPLAIAALASGPLWARVALLATAELVSSIGVMLFDVNLNALQTSVIPDRVRSRTAGAFTAVNYGIRPLGALAGGWLGSTLGLRATLLVAAVGGALSFLWLLPSPIPGVRSLDAEPPAGL